MSRAGQAIDLVDDDNVDLPARLPRSAKLVELFDRSNWANDSRTLRVNRPIEVVVLNCWVTETNDTP
jgi:hypothetical protein